MTAVAHAKGVTLVLKVGDGASPEVFTPKCSINSERGITFTATLSDTVIPDCTDPEAIATVARDKTDYSASFTGAGILDVGEELEMFNWLVSPDSKNCKVIVAGAGGTTFTAAWHLGEFAITGNLGGKLEFSCSLSSDGAVTGAAT